MVQTSYSLYDHLNISRGMARGGGGELVAPLLSADDPHASPTPSLPPHMFAGRQSTEVAVLIVVATVGMVGNFAIIAVVLILGSLRRAANAFVLHQCALDFLKAAFCLPFAQTLVGDQPRPICSMLGGSYVVLVTTSSFNLLALVMNEAYNFSDLTLNIKDSRNFCCAVFGISTIWFTSVIMNLGVAFIPGNPSYDRRIGHCIFIYGVTRNYVLHLLWIVLVTMAMSLTVTYLVKLYKDIRRISYYRLSTLVRATVTIDPKLNSPSLLHKGEVKDKHHIKWVQRVTMKRFWLLVILIIFFIVFWYPLFMLTAADPGFHAPPVIYVVLTIFAWSNPTLTPLIMMLFIKTTCCCGEGPPSVASPDTSPTHSPGAMGEDVEDVDPGDPGTSTGFPGPESHLVSETGTMSPDDIWRNKVRGQTLEASTSRVVRNTSWM